MYMTDFRIYGAVLSWGESHFVNLHVGHMQLLEIASVRKETTESGL